MLCHYGGYSVAHGCPGKALCGKERGGERERLAVSAEESLRGCARWPGRGLVASHVLPHSSRIQHPKQIGSAGHLVVSDRAVGAAEALHTSEWCAGPSAVGSRGPSSFFLSCPASPWSPRAGGIIPHGRRAAADSGRCEQWRQARCFSHAQGHRECRGLA